MYPSNSSWNVFGIRFSNTQYFFMVKIVVRSRRHLFIYKIRSYCQFHNYLCKNGDVYPSNSSWKLLGICFCNIKYFSYGRNRGRRSAVSIYLKNSVILQLSELFMLKPWCVPFQFQLKCIWHTFLQYIIFVLWWKSWYEADGIYLFIKFGHIATFAIIYAKTVMCTLLIPAGNSWVYVSAI